MERSGRVELSPAAVNTQSSQDILSVDDELEDEDEDDEVENEEGTEFDVHSWKNVSAVQLSFNFIHSAVYVE